MMTIVSKLGPLSEVAILLIGCVPCYVCCAIFACADNTYRDLQDMWTIDRNARLADQSYLTAGTK